MTHKIGRQKKIVYLMPHSHDDVGWLDTIDSIYLHGPGVRNIITSYIEQLQLNKDRKFVQVETVYFQRWWNEQSVITQQKVKELVENGQLGFAAGGLVMNDEATPYYEDIIDQMTQGHEFLFKTFGVIPSIGWQIDPFGHSNAQSVLSYLFGMNAQYFARIDYQDKQNREQHQELELIHIPKTNDEQIRKIFIHVNYQHYSSPPSMDFDVLRNSGGYVNDQNVQRKADDLQNYFLKQAKSYKGNIITHTLGDDNEWSNAKTYYENTEKIINYINSHPDKYNITIKFGTPEDYINSVNEFAEEILYPTKNDDFFPYADKQHCYWTGYFSSKAAFKGFVRYTGRQFQQIKSFISYELAQQQREILDMKESLLNAIQNLGSAMGVSQHHDAVTGTSKDFVTLDYVRILYRNLTEMNQELHKLVKLVIERDIQQENIEQIYQYSYNATSAQCEEVYNNLKENKTILLMLLDTKINQNEIDVIKVKVPKITLNVIDSTNQYIQGDIICSNQRDEDDCTLYFNFKIKKGIQYFKLKQSDQTNSSTTIIQEQIFTNITSNTLISLDNGPEFQLQYKYYVASTNNLQPSGAYIFRPEGGAIVYGQITQAKVYNGSVVTELNIQRNNVDTWIRKYKISDLEYEIETFIDSIAKEQNKGKEVLVVFKSEEIKNDKTFYTDSNGMDLQQRKIGHRETWSLQSNEFIAENYYPVNGIIQITDKNSNYTMAVINDRAQGGSSFSDGEIELMIHRRMYLDDRRGVGEPLNEEEDNSSCTDPIKQNCQRKVGLKQNVIHKLLFFNPNTHPNAARKSQLFLDFYPLKLFAIDSEALFKDTLQQSLHETLLDQIKIFSKQDTAIAKLYIIPKESQNEFLVRIHNMQESESINFTFPDNVSYEETILSGLRSWTEQQKIRLKWNSNQDKENQEKFIPNDEVGPQQIKTFVIKI